ncbi:serine/threonine-protein kinase [Paramicrobacterium agarici]|uniref:serine/threonine-protein kinase n=1 Tax=Paramicrobacterium agarici TaxID=630514 RepID=UPI001153D249|nr:serine/threonine-protein kinase [Microbacterium agarici]TQO23264.1 serine/threonine protein kinase [Microbacterium agarici]
MGSPPQIDGYSYVKLLGRGGFSDVYLYHQQLPNRFVAIKVLRTDALSEALRRQFTAEANLMARVSSHSAIATIYAAGVDAAEQPYLVMEYCSGGSLGARFRHAPLDLADVLHIGVRVASALESAHRAGVVHRDVKPANVLINDYGAAVLTDFGISAIADGFPEATRIREQAYATQSTVENDASALGMSIPWAAPESFDDEPRIDVRSDVFSLAATLFSLLEGRSPFEVPGASNRGVQLMARIQNGAITPMQRQGLPQAVVDALLIGLNRSPEHRFPTALAFAQRLQQLERELGLAPTRIEVPSSPNEVPAADTVLRQGPTSDTSLPAPAATRPAAVTELTPSGAVPHSTARVPRRQRGWVVGGVVAAAAVVALVLGVGIPLALNSFHPPAPTATTTAPSDLVIDELRVVTDDDAWTVAVPEDLAPPTALEGKVLVDGESSTTITDSSRVSFGYDTAPWNYGGESHLSPPDSGSFDTAVASGRALSQFLGVDLEGMPVGTVVIAAAPQGYFAQHSPLDAEMTTQIVVVRVNALT